MKDRLIRELDGEIEYWTRPENRAKINSLFGTGFLSGLRYCRKVLLSVREGDTPEEGVADGLAGRGLLP